MAPEEPASSIRREWGRGRTRRLATRASVRSAVLRTKLRLRADAHAARRGGRNRFAGSWPCPPKQRPCCSRTCTSRAAGRRRFATRAAIRLEVQATVRPQLRSGKSHQTHPALYYSGLHMAHRTIRSQVQRTPLLNTLVPCCRRYQDPGL